MVWPFSSSKDDNPQSSNTDPLRNLDPSLRAFLEKESPVKYERSENPPPPPPDHAPQPSTSLPQSPAQATSPKSDPSSTPPDTKNVPAQSLYPDGRYANLWSTYKPLREIESAHRSDQEKLLDIIEGYKERKAQIGRAALENCAMEQWAVNDCFTNGGWASRMTMCRAETRGLERCYTMQSRFLKALGYLSTYDRPPEVDEQIQMHADSLYHRMLDQERAVEEAKAAGLPVPSFPPIMPSLPHNSSSALSDTASSLEKAGIQQAPSVTREELTPRVKAQLEKRFKGLSPEEREVEEKAIAMEIVAGEVLQKQIEEVWDEQEKGRRLRREQGRETFSDRISRWFRA